jgi:hypothetical protein
MKITLSYSNQRKSFNLDNFQYYKIRIMEETLKFCTFEILTKTNYVSSKTLISTRCLRFNF